MIALHSISSITTGFVVLALAAATQACATQTPGSESTSSTASALGEPGCATETLSPFQVGTTSGTVGNLIWSDGNNADPGVGYGSSSCPTQYVVEVDNLAGGGGASTPTAYITTNSDFDEPPGNNQADCTASHLTLGVYAFQNGAWNTTPISQSDFAGTWSGTCNFGSGELSLSLPANTTRLRLAGSAYQVEQVKGGTAQSLAPVGLEFFYNQIIK